eukprot:Pgem_evm1s673
MCQLSNAFVLATVALFNSEAMASSITARSTDTCAQFSAGSTTFVAQTLKLTPQSDVASFTMGFYGASMNFGSDGFFPDDLKVYAEGSLIPHTAVAKAVGKYAEDEVWKLEFTATIPEYLSAAEKEVEFEVSPFPYAV